MGGEQSFLEKWIQDFPRVFPSGDLTHAVHSSIFEIQKMSGLDRKSKNESRGQTLKQLNQQMRSRSVSDSGLWQLSWGTSFSSVGIDFESTERELTKGVFERICPRPQERNQVPESHQNQMRLAAWVAKEAAFKCASRRGSEKGLAVLSQLEITSWQAAKVSDGWWVEVTIHADRQFSVPVVVLQTKKAEEIHPWLVAFAVIE